jgi:cytochrome c
MVWKGRSQLLPVSDDRGDYINRAMPASNPGSLKPNEVYALVAFLCYRNGIINETT